MLNILFVNDNAREVGGTESHIRTLARELVEGGDKVYLFTTRSNDNARFILPPASIYFSNSSINPLTRLKNRRAAFEIMEAVRDWKIDVVHAHNIFSAISPYFISQCRRKGIPVIMTLHDYHLICPRTILFRRKTSHSCIDNCGELRCELFRCQGLMKYIYHAIKKRLWGSYLKGTTYVAPSRYMKTTMEKNGVSPVTLVYNGVVPPQPRPENKGENINFVFSSRLYPEKGILPLIEGFDRFVQTLLPRKRKRVKLTITGCGIEEGDVRERIARSENMVYEGFVSRQRLTQIFRSAHYLLVPSLWPENCSISILEGIAAGVPVITSDMGGCPELVRHGTEGYLIPFSGIGTISDPPPSPADLVTDTLVHSYKFRARHSHLSANCLVTARKRFTARKMCRNLKKVYESVLN